MKKLIIAAILAPTILATVGCASPQAVSHYQQATAASDTPVGQSMTKNMAHNRCHAQALQANYSAAAQGMFVQALAQVQVMDACMAGYGYYR